MTYIILTRDPRTKKLLAIDNPDQETVAEFPSEEMARDAAGTVPICRAWGFRIIDLGEQA